MEKRCSSCRLVKDINLFVTRKEAKDGHRGQCKECYNKLAESISNRSREKHRELIRARAKKWQKDNHDKYLEQSKASNARNKEHRNIQQKEAHKKDTKKKIAYKYFRRVQKTGLIPPPLTWCQLCGKDIQHDRIVAHHADYDYPFSVIYLCQEHHSAVHMWLKTTQKEN